MYQRRHHALINSPDVYTPKVPPRSAWHRVRAVDYHVSEWGDHEAPLIIVLHGWGDTGACFQFVVDALHADYFVIAPDWRGFGETRYRCEAYWFPDYLADLHELLDIYSPGGAAALVGHSMGGNIAGLYAGIVPERVAAIVNIEGFGLADSDPNDAPAHYRRWIERGRHRPAFSIYQSFDDLATRIQERSPGLDRCRARFVARQWAERAADGLIHLKADPAHKLPNAVQYRRAEARACWSRVTAPALLVSGRDSEFLHTAGSWVDGSPEMLPPETARRAVIPEAGHMVHFDQPALLAAAIERFLQDL